MGLLSSSYRQSSHCARKGINKGLLTSHRSPTLLLPTSTLYTVQGRYSHRNDEEQRLPSARCTSSSYNMPMVGGFSTTFRFQPKMCTAAGSLRSLSTGTVDKTEILDSESLRQGVHFDGLERLGLGGQKWARGERYQDIVHTALDHGITVLEAAGPEGGVQALADAVRQFLLRKHEQSSEATSKDLPKEKISLLQRVGYRTVHPPMLDDEEEPKEPMNAEKRKLETMFIHHDVPLEAEVVRYQSKINNKENQDESTDVGESLSSVGESPQPKAHVVHNMTSEYLRRVIPMSPLVQLAADFPLQVQVTILLHNPEVQASILKNAHSRDERQLRIRERLVDAFCALEDLIVQGYIASYGVVSNGLGLPPDHPLHLDWKDTLLAAVEQAEGRVSSAKASSDEDKVSNNHKSNFSVVQLPANLLEKTGFEVARKIRAESSSIKILAMRPLAGYPDRGTGRGYPFILADYQIPGQGEGGKTMQWTHTMAGPPAVYEAALKTAMSHFDAEEILQMKQSGQELTAEQRETLDGCKLLQSLLHDLDVGLEKVRSFAQHEDELYRTIIPLIRDTFEGYDEETAEVLQSFFRAYSLAVRYAIARNTRRLLVQGEPGSNVPMYKDLTSDLRLQEYAMKFVWNESAFDVLVAGCSQVSHVLDDVDIARRFAKRPTMSSEKGVDTSA